MSHLLEFAKVSGAGKRAAQVEQQFLSVLDGISAVRQNAFDEADFLRQTLVSRGFRYDDNIFTAHDIIRKRAGNCLGLSLLFGGALLDRGYEASFTLATHPKDGIHDEDVKLFGELIRGEHFSYDNPPLPQLRDASEADLWAPIHRFAVLQHPVLMAEGRHFEVTSLEEGDPERLTKAERFQPVAFNELLGCVYLELAHSQARSKSRDLMKIRSMLERSLEIWPGNREAWRSLCLMSLEMGDETLHAFARSRYESIGGDDSAYYEGLYEMTDDITYLDLALEKFPENILAFTTRHVEHETDQREAKFNLAVAACCVLNSCVVDLSWFYRRYENSVRQLYGNQVWKSLVA